MNRFPKAVAIRFLMMTLTLALSACGDDDEWEIDWDSPDFNPEYPIDGERVDRSKDGWLLNYLSFQIRGESEAVSKYSGVGILAQVTETMNLARCTAFLIAPTKVMTNSHCVPADLPAGSTCKDRLVYGTSDGQKFSCKKVIARFGEKDSVLTWDYAVIELDRPASVAPFQLNTKATGEKGASILAIDHDEYLGGGYLNGQLKVKNCEVVYNSIATGFSEKVGALGLTSCLAINGNSGSPVISHKDGNVFAILHGLMLGSFLRDYANLVLRHGFATEVSPRFDDLNLATDLRDYNQKTDSFPEKYSAFRSSRDRYIELVEKFFSNQQASEPFHLGRYLKSGSKFKDMESDYGIRWKLTVHPESNVVVPVPDCMLYSAALTANINFKSEATYLRARVAESSALDFSPLKTAEIDFAYEIRPTAASQLVPAHVTVKIDESVWSSEVVVFNRDLERCSP